MTEDVRLGKPKLVPLGDAELAEAMRLLAALLRASIACAPTGGRAETPAHPDPGVSQRRMTKPKPPRTPHTMTTGTLPMAQGANGKSARHKAAGRTP